jgi:hypothetical protein
MKTVKINEIDEMLQKLPPKQLREVRTFVSYLIDKEPSHCGIIGA